MNWKTPQKCKSVPRLLSMIVGLTMGSVRFSLYPLLVSCIYRSNAHGSLPTDVPPALIQTTVTRTFAKPAVNQSREPTHGTRSNADVADNFLFQVIFVFPLFQFITIYYHYHSKTMEK